MSVTSFKGMCQCCPYPVALEVYYVEMSSSYNTSTNDRGSKYDIKFRARLSDGSLAPSNPGSGYISGEACVYSARALGYAHGSTLKSGFNFFPDSLLKEVAIGFWGGSSGNIFLPYDRDKLDYFWGTTNCSTSNTRIILPPSPSTIAGYWHKSGTDYSWEEVDAAYSFYVNGTAGTDDVETDEILLTIPLEVYYTE